MSKVLSIATTEYLNAVRSKAFVIGVVLMPVLMAGGLIAHVIAEQSVDLRDRKFAVVDGTGRLYPALEEALAQRNAAVFEKTEEGGDGEQVGPRFLMERYEHPAGDSRSPELVLSDRVRTDELFAFVVIGVDAFESESGANDLVAYHSDSPTFDDLPDWIEDTVQEAVELERFERANVDLELVHELTRRVRFQDRDLIEVSATGEEVGGEEEDEFQNFVVPSLSMFLLFMLIMMSAPQALNVVLEEKMQKISEVLVSAVTPFQLMMGKVVGTVFVSMTLSALYLGAIWISTRYWGVDHFIPLSFYGWFVFFQLLAMFIYTAMFSAIGAACSEMRDAQSLMTPMMLLVVIPIFFWMVVLRSPDSPTAVAVSLFPPATPMLMMMRVAIPPGPPAWQLFLSIVLTLAFTVACVFASAKVFRIGLLATGQAPTLRKLVSWIVSK